METPIFNLFNDSDGTSTCHKNISPLDSKDMSYFNNKSSFSHFSTKKGENINSKKKSIEGDETNTINLEISHRSNNISSNQMQTFFKEIFKLKKLVIELNNQFETKNSENEGKENKIKDLEKICMKNKKKIKKIKSNIKFHEEKIIQISGKLNFIENSSCKMPEKVSVDSKTFLEKNMLSVSSAKHMKGIKMPLSHRDHISYQLIKPKAKKNKF